jgi:hypothetical protein
MISTNAKVAIVDTALGMEVLCYGNRLEAVRALMENARIAPKDTYFGSPEHEAAVRNIRDHCDVVLKAIEKDRAEEEEIARGERRPE